MRSCLSQFGVADKFCENADKTSCFQRKSPIWDWAVAMSLLYFLPNSQAEGLAAKLPVTKCTFRIQKKRGHTRTLNRYFVWKNQWRRGSNSQCKWFSIKKNIQFQTFSIPLWHNPGSSLSCVFLQTTKGHEPTNSFF